jgi:hypothetical protein
MTAVSGQLQVQPDFLEYILFLEAKRRRRRWRRQDPLGAE